MLTIGQIQQALIEAGETPPQSELTSQTLGPGTIECIKHFQANHVDTRPGTLYHPLTVDGVVGPATEWALQHPSGGGRFTAAGWRYRSDLVPANVRGATMAAVGEIGNAEQPDGSNSVANNRYGNVVNGQSVAWCAAFVSWCFTHNDQNPFPRQYLAANDFKEWGERTGNILPLGTAAIAGDLWVLVRGDGHGHVELIVNSEPDGTKLISTVGGNVSNAVRGGRRDPSLATCIVRPIK